MAEEELLLRRKNQRWFIFVFFFLSGIISASLSSRLPDIQQMLKVNNSVFGMVLSSLYAGLFIGLTFASWLVASYGSKKVMIITCVLSGLSLVFAGMFSSYVLAMLVLFLMGISRTIFNLSANTGAIEVQSLYDRPIIAGFHGVWSMACFVAGGIGQLMISYTVSPFSHFLFIAAFVCFSIVFLKNKKQGLSIEKERRPFFVKPDRYLFLLGLMALCTMLCEGAMFDWSVNYFEKVVHAKRNLITTGYLSFVIAMALGRLVGDKLIAEFGMFRLLFINGILLAIGFSIAATFPIVLPAAMGFLLIGLGDSVMVPVIYLLATRSPKMTAAYSLSIVTFIGYTGFLVGPLLIGNISQYFGLPTAFYCLSGISLIIIVLSLRVKKLIP
jgi:MFS family permease